MLSDVPLPKPGDLVRVTVVLLRINKEIAMLDELFGLDASWATLATGEASQPFPVRQAG